MNKIVALRYLSENYIFPTKVSTYHPDFKDFFHILYPLLISLTHQKKYVHTWCIILFKHMYEQNLKIGRYVKLYF